MNNGIAPVSVHRKISCLRVFYRFLRKEGIVKSDPMEKVVLPKRKKTLPVFVGRRLSILCLTGTISVMILPA